MANLGGKFFLWTTQKKFHVGNGCAMCFLKKIEGALIVLKFNTLLKRDDYRATCQRLADENETVTNSLYQAERDTIEIISVLKREDISKENQIAELTEKIEKLDESVRVFIFTGATFFYLNIPHYMYSNLNSIGILFCYFFSKHKKTGNLIENIIFRAKTPKKC